MTTDVGTARLNPLAHTSFDVRLDGRPLGITELDDLVDVRVQRGVRTVGRASLTFVDRGYRLVTSRLAIGQDVEMRVDGTVLVSPARPAIRPSGRPGAQLAEAARLLDDLDGGLS